MTEKIKECPSFSVSIWLAGSLIDAERISRAFCMERGLCVTVTATNFVYTGGAESGALVRLVNYPRFPMSALGITEIAIDLARCLRDGMSQWSVMVETPEKTIWLTNREAA